MFFLVSLSCSLFIFHLLVLCCVVCYAQLLCVVLKFLASLIYMCPKNNYHLHAAYGCACQCKSQALIVLNCPWMTLFEIHAFTIINVRSCVCVRAFVLHLRSACSYDVANFICVCVCVRLALHIRIESSESHHGQMNYVFRL